MSDSAPGGFVSTLGRARFTASLVLTLLLGVACSDSEGGSGVDIETNGGTAGTGGLEQGTGGLVPGAGGSVRGAGGSVQGAGGFVQGAGGLVQGAGGLVQGAGGSVQGTGGSVQGTGGSVPGAGGSSPGAGGSAPGAGGSEPGTGGTPSCQGDFPTANLDGAVHSVTVDDGGSWGGLPHFWNTYGTGHLGLFLRTDRDWGATLQAHVVDGVENLGLTSLRQHGLFHEDIGIYHEENGVPVYDFSVSDQVFDFFVDNGIMPIVELGSMPRDLAEDPSEVWFDWEMGRSPPKDFNLWQELVYRFVEHSVQRYGTEIVSQWYFEVWNEPECCRGQFWTGTLEQYLELYDHAAAAVRAALPGGRVGGPVASQPIELTQNTAVGEMFLDHVTTDNYVTPGTPAGLDLFIYHTWSFIDGAVNGYFEGLDLLDSYGLQNVSTAITEFGPTWEFGLYDEPQENAQGAAFVAQTYADIAVRCAREGRRFPITYSWWVLSDVFEEGTYRENDPFIGCMGLISRESIRKPAYNAYKFLAQMGSEQVPLSVTGGGDVGGMASRDVGGGVQVLIYNGQNPGEGPTDDVYYTVTGPQDIAVTVSGLDAAVPYDVTAYRIDDTHGNAYATWEGMGRPSMSAMSDADWTELRATMDSPAEPLGQGLCGATFTHRFSLPSPGVLFVTLTPSS